MATPAQTGGDKLADTGRPDDPAKQENPDTRLDQLKPKDEREKDTTQQESDVDPVLDTTREAGQGSG